MRLSLFRVTKIEIRSIDVLVDNAVCRDIILTDKDGNEHQVVLFADRRADLALNLVGRAMTSQCCEGDSASAPDAAVASDAVVPGACE